MPTMTNKFGDVVEIPEAEITRATASGYSPNINQGITSESLTKENPIKLPDITQPSTTGADASIAGANTELTSKIASMTPPATDAEKTQQSLLDQMASLTGEMGQKAADQLTAEQSAKIPELSQQYADINAKILAKTAEYNVAKTNLEGQPIPTHYIKGQQAQLANQQAAEIGLLQAQAQGLSGQITVAQNTVNRAIDLKYSTIESNLNTYTAQLNALMPTLNKEEKIRAEAQLAIKEKEAQEAADKKAEEKQIQSLMVKATENGITDTNVLTQISNAKTYEEAASILAKYAPNALVPTTIREIGNRTYLINTQTGEKIKDLGYSGASGGGGTTLSDSSIQYYANQVAQGLMDISDVPKEYKDAVISYNANPKALDLTGISFDGLTAKLPDGSTATFPDQKSLDEFKKDNGLSGKIMQNVDPVSAITTPTSSTQTSPIEQRIQQMTAQGWSKADIRFALGKQYTQNQINQSTVGTILGKASTGLYKLFGGK